MNELAALAETVPGGLAGLATALAIGLLIGLERGWHERERADGQRVAGLRTFGLIGLLGGVTATLPAPAGTLPAAHLVGLGVLGLLLVASWWMRARQTGQLSATTVVAALLTHVLGALAVLQSPLLALALAAVVAVLLDLKPALHGGLRLIEQRELSAALQLLLLSAAVLPWLPDRGLGPYGALNPARLWWAVLLVAALSLGGRIAMRLSGPRRGALWTGLFGGLASSTAATLALARQARRTPQHREAATCGALAASAVMALRLALIVTGLQAEPGPMLVLPLLAAGSALLAFSLWRWRRLDGLPLPPVDSAPAGEAPDEAPAYDLGVALGFGVFLAAMALLGRAGHALFGSSALYALAALAGLADVDAILITVVRWQEGAPLAAPVMQTAVGLAVLANSLSKAAIAATVGGAAMGRRLALGQLGALAVGGLVAVALAAA